MGPLTVRTVTGGDVPKAVLAAPVAAPGKSMETKGVSKVSLHLPPQLEIVKDTFPEKRSEERLFTHLLHHFQVRGGKKAVVFVRSKASVFRLTLLLRFLMGDNRGDRTHKDLSAIGLFYSYESCQFSLGPC